MPYVELFETAYIWWPTGGGETGDWVLAAAGGASTGKAGAGVDLRVEGVYGGGEEPQVQGADWEGSPQGGRGWADEEGELTEAQW